MNVFLLSLLYLITFGWTCAFIAGEKNRSKVSWFFLGMLLGVIGIMTLTAIPSLTKPDLSEPLFNPCPKCGNNLFNSPNCSYCSYKGVQSSNDEFNVKNQSSPRVIFNASTQSEISKLDHLLQTNKISHAEYEKLLKSI